MPIAHRATTGTTRTTAPAEGAAAGAGVLATPATLGRASGRQTPPITL
jgi:hypothetical protein